MPPRQQRPGQGVVTPPKNPQHVALYVQHRLQRLRQLKVYARTVVVLLKKALGTSTLKYEVIERLGRPGNQTRKRSFCQYDHQVFRDTTKWLIGMAAIRPEYNGVLEYFGGLLVVCALDRAYDIHTSTIQNLDYTHQTMLLMLTKYALQIFDFLIENTLDSNVKVRSHMFRDISVFIQYTGSFNDTINQMSDERKTEEIAHHHVQYRSKADEVVRAIFALFPRRRYGQTSINAQWTALKRDGLYKEVANKLNSEQSRRS